MADASDAIDVFLVAAPGLEDALALEATSHRFDGARAVAGGVKVRGSWADLWRANLVLRGAGRVLVRLDSFEAHDLDKLARRARRTPWRTVLRPDVPIALEAVCRQSRIYHSGAAIERVADAIGAKLGAPVQQDAPVTVMVRIERDICTISVDTSGDLLHKRGHKAAVHRAPLRETFAALFLGQCGFTGSEPVLDPMCGAGTFVIEAAEIAAGLVAGRARTFAFEHLATFDAARWQALRTDVIQQAAARPPVSVHFHGSDRDAVAIETSRRNARAAGIDAITTFCAHPVSDLQRPAGPPGLVMINPPYGARIGDPAALKALYRALGRVLLERFSDWRVGLVTADKQLAYATALPFVPTGPPVAHGGLRVTLFRTDALP